MLCYPGLDKYFIMCMYIFRFKKLDLDNSGSLSVDEFMSLPELQQNPLVQRVIGSYFFPSAMKLILYHSSIQLVTGSYSLLASTAFIIYYSQIIQMQRLFCGSTGTDSTVYRYSNSGSVYGFIRGDKRI